MGGRRPGLPDFAWEVISSWFTCDHQFPSTCMDYLCWMLLRLSGPFMACNQVQSPEEHKISRWRGFHAITQPGIPAETTLATTRWSMHRQATLSLLICPSMQMPSSYSWNTQRSLKTLIKIGGFHIALNYLSLCERKYANSGLEDLLIESGVYAAGTTSVLTLRKSYNRGIHAPKLVMEALRLRLLWKPFLEWLSKKAGALDNKVKQDVVHRSSECRTTIKMKGFVNDPWLKLQGCVERLFSLLDAFKSESKEKSEVFGFWVEYIVMVLML